ncbi:MAG: NYN domain-containing protein [Candidatus Omnitrophota bacterium]|nr:NYN domain-containing protein [Candidatus Omnitrophota bacterium]
MKTIILDAYNVIHELPELSAKLRHGLRDARKALLNLMVDWKRENGFKWKVCIVYDGQDGVFNPEKTGLCGVDCVFTGSREEADDRIISIVRRASKTTEIVVVSADGRVVNGCRVHGARVESPSFLKKKPKKKNGKTVSAAGKKISGKDEHEINKYYKEALGL